MGYTLAMTDYRTSYETERDSLWDNLATEGIATEDELKLAADLCGNSIETLNAVLFSRTGYRNWAQYKEAEMDPDEIHYDEEED